MLTFTTIETATRRRDQDNLNEQADEAIFTGLAAAPSPAAVVEVRVLRGPMARLPAYATAFLRRHRRPTSLCGAADPLCGLAGSGLHLARSLTGRGRTVRAEEWLFGPRSLA